jgi:hypothetical protein
MFTLNGTPVSIDNPFTTEEGVTYPHLRDPSVREALGVVEVADPAYYDQRFYWGVDNPKDLTQLKSEWIAQTKSSANSLLAQTDWMVIRKAERDIAIPVDVIAERGSIILDQDSKQQAITAATTVEQLIAAVFPPVQAVQSTPALASASVGAL